MARLVGVWLVVFLCGLLGACKDEPPLPPQTNLEQGRQNVADGKNPPDAGDASTNSEHDSRGEAAGGTAVEDAGAPEDSAVEEPIDGALPEGFAPAPQTQFAVGETTTVELSGDKATLVVRRGEQTLLTLPSDAFRLGTVSEMDPSLNYNPYRLTDAAGGGHQKPTDLVWVKSLGLSAIEETQAGWQTIIAFEDGRTSPLELSIEGERLRLEWVPPDGLPCPYRQIRVVGDNEEGLYGMGGVLDHVNHRGQTRALSIEVADLESGYNERHIPVPLLLGTTGWGWFVESYRPGVFEIAVESSTVSSATFGFANALEEKLVFHLFTAAHPLDLTAHYYDITGYPGPVAPWALGPWIWRDEVSGQEKVVEDLETIRNLDLPTTGYWIDRPYATDVNSFDFKAESYPDPQGMIEHAHSLGFEMALWHTPYVDPEGSVTGALFEEATENGYFAPQLMTALGKWGPPLDFSNPDAVTWWQEKLTVYQKMGITGYKLDFAEEVIPGLFGARLPALFHDGSDEFTMHRRYSILYHETYRPLIPEDGGFLLCRAGSYGDQVNGCIMWPGDIDATLAKHGEVRTDKEGKDYISVGGLPAAIVAGSSLGVSGFPLFASDTGGYLHAPPTKECFTRWAEHTAFSPAMQVGTNTNDLPWEFGKEKEYDETLIERYRVLAEAHLRLHPYLWSAWQEVAKSGRAIQRPLGFAHPELNTHPDDIYMLGEDLLVAPVIEPGATGREVVLPSEDWVHWWTGKRNSGGIIQQESPLGQPPVWIRAGVPLPLLPEGIETLLPTTEPDTVTSAKDGSGLTIWITPGPPALRTLYDGSELEQAPAENGFTFRWKPGSVFTGPIQLEWREEGAALAGVSETDGTALPENTSGSPGSWSVGPHGPRVFISGEETVLHLMPANP